MYISISVGLLARYIDIDIDIDIMILIYTDLPLFFVIFRAKTQ